MTIGRARTPGCVSPRRSSNANGLCGQNSAGSGKSMRPIKGIICDDISEFESYHPSHAVGSRPLDSARLVITSISWVSRIEDAKESLLRSRWDLVIVDEAHKMAAYSADKKTLAYKLGEALSTMTDHYLLMTATPHKGDPENFCLFLELLYRYIYVSVKSLEEAMRRHHAPFYLRRTKEALVSFPDPDTGEVKKLFTKREVKTTTFEFNAEEFAFYDALPRSVGHQSYPAFADDSAAGPAVGSLMAH